jgi:hypothetical protein
LPAGLAFHDNGNGTATISGTPGATTVGSYPVVITAKNSIGTATKTVTITVQQVPVFTSATSVTVKHGVLFSFAVKAGGTPAPAITRTGTLPKGVTFTNGTGTATLSGTPSVVGTSIETFSAKNSVGTTTQTFTITVT